MATSHIKFSKSLTDEEKHLRTKYAQLRHLKVQLETPQKQPTKETSSTSTLIKKVTVPRARSTTDAKEIAKGLVLAGKIKIPTKRSGDPIFRRPNAIKRVLSSSSGDGGSANEIKFLKYEEGVPTSPPGTGVSTSSNRGVATSSKNDDDDDYGSEKNWKQIDHDNRARNWAMLSKYDEEASSSAGRFGTVSGAGSGGYEDDVVRGGEDDGKSDHAGHYDESRELDPREHSRLSKFERYSRDLDLSDED